MEQHVANLLILCTVFSYLVISIEATRTLSITYNEQCDLSACAYHPDKTNYVNLVHVTAKGNNDTIHYLWSSIGAPALLLARTTNDADLFINWTALLSETMDGSIWFEPTDDVYHSSAFVFTRLIEYNDTDDSAKLDKMDNTTVTRLQDLDWQSASHTIDLTKNSVIFNSSGDLFGNESIISLHLRAFDTDGRFATLPHLQHTENSTQFDLIMQNLTSNYVHSRYALETMMVGSGTPNDQINMRQINTIDDEYTPGTFYTLDVRLPDSPQGSYSQWKPVSYRKRKPNMEAASHVTAYDLHAYGDDTFMPTLSIAHAFFSKEMLSNHSAFLNISFGATRDGFYRATNYSSWSATIGYGEPPEETMSPTVYIVISASLGVPLLVMVIGGTGRCITNHRKRTSNLVIN